jgi:excisionase family DNA binding protein
VSESVRTNGMGSDALVGGALLTPEEVGERLRIGRTFVYKLLREGAIPSVKIGRVRRVRVQDADRYVRSLLEERDR